MNKILALLALAVLSFQLASAMTINSVSVDNISPGTEGVIRIEVENTLNELAKDINLNLNFQGLPFIPVGSSSGGVDELKEDDEENFAFRIRASNDVAPGDYQIPYVLTFRINSGPQTREGSIGNFCKCPARIIIFRRHRKSNRGQAEQNKPQNCQ